MLSISQNPCNNNSKLYNVMLNKHSRQFFHGADVSNLLEAGDNALNQNNGQAALASYNEALKKSPNNVEINRKIAKAQFSLKDYVSAEKNYRVYLDANQNDIEAWIELGENQRQRGLYQDAKKCFQKASSIDPANDMARRSIMETENNIKSGFSPKEARAEKQKYAEENLQKALNMAVSYMTPEFMKDLENVQIKFGQTAKMGGTSNIAQYENKIKTITVSDTYIYAAPQVIAAYLVHESIHAKDADPYTSVREEQDAYEIATKFWIKNSGGVKDPEMDYAANLYKKSPDALSNRVEEIYKLRDPDIAMTSPNHPPQKKFHFNKTKTKAADQPIREYGAIA